MISSLSTVVGMMLKLLELIAADAEQRVMVIMAGCMVTGFYEELRCLETIKRDKKTESPYRWTKGTLWYKQMNCQRNPEPIWFCLYSTWAQIPGPTTRSSHESVQFA